MTTNNGSADDFAPIVDGRGPDPHPAAAAELPPGQSQVTLVPDGSHAVLWVSGEVDVANADHLRGMGCAALDDVAVSDLVVDLSRVTFLDSSGLGAIVQLHGAATNTGKPLRLRSVPPSVVRVFELTGLDKEFDLEVADTDRC